MLHQLADHISNCYARAADARRRADETAGPERKADLLFLEENWKRLAQSYEVSERVERSLAAHNEQMLPRVDWQRVATAPFDRILELAVIGAAGIDTIAFPCRRVLNGWIAAASGERLELRPTHWREWISSAIPEALSAQAFAGSLARPAARVSPLHRR